MSGGSGSTGQTHSITLDPRITWTGWVPNNLQTGQTTEVRWIGLNLGDDAAFTVEIVHVDSGRSVASGNAEWNGVVGSFSWQIDAQDSDYGVDGIARYAAEIRCEALGIGGLSIPLTVWRPTAYVKQVSNNFASGLNGHELRIEYGVTDLSQVYRSGLIRIFGTGAGDDPIFQRRLEVTDIGPSGTTRVFDWNGVTGGTQPDGSVYEVPGGPFQHEADRDKFASALFSPYLVQVLFWPTEEPGNDDAALASPAPDAPEAERVRGRNVSEIEIAEVELRPSAFYADETTINDDGRRFQLALHRAGYSCGPIDGDLGKDNTTEEGRNFEAGVRDFQRCHWETPWPDDHLQRVPLVVDGNAGNKTRTAAQDATVIPRRVLENGRLPAAGTDGKIFVYDHTHYQIQNLTDENNVAEWNRTIHSNVELGQDNKDQRERSGVARPWIPIELQIKVKGRNGAAVFAPLAVGNVRVDWNVEDPDEDLAVIGADNTFVPRDYVFDALAATKNTNAANPGNDNAPSINIAGQPGTFVGVRGGTMQDYLQNLLTATNDDGTVVALDFENDRVWRRAGVEGNLAGRSCVVFRPSIIGGDNYKVTAQVTFDDDDPNKDALTAKYVQAGPAGAPYRAQTGTLTVWRKVRVAAHITWGVSPGPADPMYVIPWTGPVNGRNIAALYRKAHIVFEGDGLDDLTPLPPSRVIPIQNILSNAELRNIFGNSFQGNDLRFTEQRVLRLVQAQRAGETGQQFMQRLRNDVNNFWTNARQYRLIRLLGQRVRRLSGPGWVLVDMHFHNPRAVFTAINNTNGVAAINTVRGQKERLRDLGHYAGPIDNTRDPAFEPAVRAFQASRNLNVDGDPGPETREELLEQHHLSLNGAQVVIPSLVNWPAARGMHNGAMWIQQDVAVWKNLGPGPFVMQPAERAYVVAHEMGHCKWRMHHVQFGNPSTFPAWHDTNWNPCVMSYPIDISTSQPGSPVVVEADPTDPMLMRNMRPHFCGKCLLGLRGWPVTGPVAGLPATS